ncbi:hypothetical protein FGG08_007310 [Glutinoglossum americanum]|uniref:DUF6594 domain-containing protein n=1 Tax=Glutinoglossum americanum TaxID=1670608 RepID=A0A9P8HR30_9PEZI|nr:hypothetical protein FGG08_007310 [Glutinoglossum americanum]
MPPTGTDVEIGESAKEFLEGFSDFSQFIASDDDLSIYRRFGSLGARNILYLQAELQLLEQNLQKLDEADHDVVMRHSDEDEKKEVDLAARAWECFEYQSKKGTERQMLKMKLILRIREVMKEYEDAIIRRSQVLALKPPSRSTLTAFTGWFRSRMPFRFSSWHLLDDESDLIALKNEADPDRLSSLTQRYFGYYLKVDRDTPKSWEPMYYFPARRVAWIVSSLSVLISAVLLIGAILALYYVSASRMGLRLSIVGGFTFVFAASIGLLTNAKRGEIFAATAANAGDNNFIPIGNYTHGGLLMVFDVAGNSDRWANATAKDQSSSSTHGEWRRATGGDLSVQLDAGLCAIAFRQQNIETRASSSRNRREPPMKWNVDKQGFDTLTYYIQAIEFGMSAPAPTTRFVSVLQPATFRGSTAVAVVLLVHLLLVFSVTMLFLTRTGHSLLDSRWQVIAYMASAETVPILEFTDIAEDSEVSD